MSKVTAIIASPRKNGNCVAIVDRMLEAAKANGAETDVFYINQLDAKGCQACMGCKKTGRCVRKDGLTDVLDAVATSDSVILATPDYFGQATSQYRMFEDRMYGFVRGDFTCSLDAGKKLAIVVTSGSGGGAKETEETIERVMTNYFKFDIIGNIVFAEGQSGPAKDSADIMSAAEALGNNL